MTTYRTEPLPPGAAGDAPPAGDATPADGARTRQLLTEVLPGVEPPLSHRPTEHAAAAPSGQPTTRFAPTRPHERRLLTGKLLANRYELGPRLGVGGMGEVYRAAHLALGVDVAVKIMHPHVAVEDEYARRFRREAHATSLLNHRNIVRVLDFGEDDGLLFIVMELLRGQPMGRWLSRSPSPPPITECIEILWQILDAFDAAHAAGIVHRDLKPENVFLSVEADGKRVVKVLDFGLAHVDDFRDAGPTLTKPDMVSGTPEFMSPEQCRSLAVCPSTDLYAIGCVLTDMLQLGPPFTGNAIEVMTQQMFVPPPPLRRSPDDEPVPPLLERLRLSLLAKVPEQRPADVREVKRLLAEAMSEDATRARLPGRKGEPAGRGALRPDAGAQITGPPPAAGAAPLAVRLVHLAPPSEHGLSTSVATGLAAQGITAAPPESAPCHAVVVDAGADVDDAAAWVRAHAGPAPVVVCLSDVTADRMSALIAAGAKDIVPYPVTSDVLARKLRRATRTRG